MNDAPLMDAAAPPDSLKRVWERPVIEEVRYEETASGPPLAQFDGIGYSGAIQ